MYKKDLITYNLFILKSSRKLIHIDCFPSIYLIKGEYFKIPGTQPEIFVPAAKKTNLRYFWQSYKDVLTAFQN